MHEQRQLLEDLNRIVRHSDSFQSAEAAGKLMRLPTGDGMALVFATDPEAPVKCALEISRAAREHPRLPLRMGIHSGPVSRVVDVNDRVNIAGAGVNVAQRVMSCGDAGHILLSKHTSDDLAEYSQWRSYLHDLGDAEVKHGVKIGLVNFYTSELGNPELPTPFKCALEKQRALIAARHVASKRKFLAATILPLAFVAIGIGSYMLFYRSHIRTDKSIAVLPFEDLTGDKQNAYFADGMQDEILTDLAKVADLKVISRTSVMQYKTDVKRNVREIAQALGVAHIVEGSVQRIGDRVRVRTQLIDARTDRHMWADEYDRDILDVFAIQTDVAEKIVEQLKVQLSALEKSAIEEQPTEDLPAYDFYLRAKDLVMAHSATRGKEKLFAAVDLLDKAVARDSRFFLAYCHLARAHELIYFNGIDHSSDRLARAETALKRAVSLRPDAGEVHLAQAQYFYWGHLDYDRALSELAIAKRTLPNEPDVFILSAFVERRRGLWDESTRNFNRALELDPQNSYLRQQLAISYSYERRFQDAAAMLDRALTVAPNDPDIRMQRATVEYESRADTKPLHSTIQAIIAGDPSAAAGLADEWFWLALCERDLTQAELALANMSTTGSRDVGVAFPRSWCQGVLARARGDSSAAQSAFIRARAETESVLQEQPDYGEALCVIGMIDAALGRKEDAVREGRRALELVPASKDALNNGLLERYLAVIYAWVGPKDLALQQLRLATRAPGSLNYGDLRLHPYWDSLRGDPRFDKIVISLAPKINPP